MLLLILPLFSAAFAYDLTYLVATAIHNLTLQGLDPYDGDNMMYALRVVNFTGLSGASCRFDFKLVLLVVV